MTTTIRRLAAALVGLLLGTFVLLAVEAGPATASGSAPTITLQPVDTTGYVDGTVQFVAAATGTISVSVWWEYSSDNGATWNSGGQFTDTYTLGSLSMSENGDLVRAGFSDPDGQTYTSAARLTVLPAQPAASLDTTELTFGSVQTNTPSAHPQTVTVTDSGSLPLGFGIAYDNSDSFYIEADTCSGHVVQPGASCSISVSFLPSHDGPISAGLAIPDNATPSQQIVDLNGFGGEQPTLGTDATLDTVAGTTFAYQVSATGTPTPAVTVEAGALPPGLTLGSDNAITGVPTTAGTFQAVLEASNGVGSPANQTLTFDIETRSRLTVSPASVPEGNSGLTAITFSYKLGRAAVAPVSFHYATKDGTATAGSDYVRTSGTVTVPAGTQVGTITVNVKGDRVVEPDEQFTLVLSKLTGVTALNHSVVGTIVNDD